MPGSFAVTVRTTYPIMGWLHDVSHTLKSGAAQTQALMRWSVYLRQRQVHSTSPLSQEWQALLGPVTLVSEGEAEKTLKGEPIGPSPVRASVVPVPPDAPCKGQPLEWHAQDWTISNRPLWGQTMWADVCADEGGDPISCHRTSIIICPGNGEANALAPAQWLAEAPAEDLATQEKDT